MSSGEIAVITLVAMGSAVVATVTLLAVVRNELNFRRHHQGELHDDDAGGRCVRLGRCLNCCKGLVGGLVIACASGAKRVKAIKVMPAKGDDDDDIDDDGSEDDADEDARKKAEQEDAAALAKKRARLPSVDLMQINQRLLRDGVVTPAQSAQISRLVVKQHVLLIMLVKKSAARSPAVALSKDPQFLKGLVKLSRSSLEAANNDETKEDLEQQGTSSFGGSGGSGGGSRGGRIGSRRSSQQQGRLLIAPSHQAGVGGVRGGTIAGGGVERQPSQWQHALRTTFFLGRSRVRGSGGGATSGKRSAGAANSSGAEREGADVEV